MRALLRLIFGVRRKAHGDPRAAQDPWLGALLDDLGDRYRLGDDSPDGIQVLRRTGRERFNPMRVWLKAAERTLAGDYDVRVHDAYTLDQGRELLDKSVSARLRALGLAPVRESVEEWAGQVITRRYSGRCDDAHAAAEAVRFMCQESDQVMDVAAGSD